MAAKTGKRLIEKLTCWSWAQCCEWEEGCVSWDPAGVWGRGSRLHHCQCVCDTAHLCVLRGLNFLHFLTDGWEQEGKSYIRPFPLCRGQRSHLSSYTLTLCWSLTHFPYNAHQFSLYISIIVLDKEWCIIVNHYFGQLCKTFADVRTVGYALELGWFYDI